jgi:hypothetical protein
MENTLPKNGTSPLNSITWLLFAFKILLSVGLVILQLKILYAGEMYEIHANAGVEDNLINTLRIYTTEVYGYFLFYPIYYGLKVICIALVIATGLQIFYKEIPFHKILFCVCLSEFILLLPEIIKTVWFGYLNTEDYLRIHYKNFTFGSLANLSDVNELKPWIWYALQSFNIWDLSYVLFLAYLIQHFLKESYDFSFKIVFYSYGLTYFAFVGLISFMLGNIK